MSVPTASLPKLRATAEFGRRYLPGIALDGTRGYQVGRPQWEAASAPPPGLRCGVLSDETVFLSSALIPTRPSRPAGLPDPKEGNQNEQDECPKEKPEDAETSSQS